MTVSTAPYIPETAPFSTEQRAWLNGYFAGLFSRMAVPPGIPAAGGETAADLAPKLDVTILYGSQTGNAEGLARKAMKQLKAEGFSVKSKEMNACAREELEKETRLLLITSTYGDGDPPDNAAGFWEMLRHAEAPRLAGARFAVLALGDTNYEKFCEFGRMLDARLEQLGASRICARVECDTDYEPGYQHWIGGLGSLLRDAPGSQANPPATTSAPMAARAPEARHDGSANRDGYSRKNPFPARLLGNANLHGKGSAKETRHVEISLEDSGIDYEAGDALGILPENCPEYVDALIDLLGARGDEAVPCNGHGEQPLRSVLATHYDVTRVNREVVAALADRTGDATLKHLSSPGINGEFSQWAWGRELIDLIDEHGPAGLSPREFVGLLKPLQPRLYSIASSAKHHPGEVHLTVGVVRYESHGRNRKGVCSTFLSDRVDATARLPVYVQPNRHFRLPADPRAPVIMVGPGTGIAPFRAFLQERRAVGATGRNWLFFGNPHSRTDFLYRAELEGMLHEGLLTRLDTAFSRDAAEKVYVQQRMLEQARELFAWLEDGACFYVCGDARRMAADVDRALHECVTRAGGLNSARAAEYVTRLKSEKRYLRDVY